MRLSGLVHDDTAGKRALHAWNHHDGEHLMNGSEESRPLSQNVKKGLPNSCQRRSEPKMKEHKSQIVDENVVTSENECETRSSWVHYAKTVRAATTNTFTIAHHQGR